MVLFASERKLELDDDQLPQTIESLVNAEAHWSVVQMNHGWFNRFEPKAQGAVAFTDDRSALAVLRDAAQRRDRAELHQMFGGAGRAR